LKLPLCFKSLKLPMFHKLDITYVSKAWNQICFKSLILHMFQKLDITCVSKLQYILTTNGLSVKLMISRSVKTCSVWLRRTTFCLHIFFIANLCRLSLCRTKYTDLKI
jgi:hypothetical protein